MFAARFTHRALLSVGLLALVACGGDVENAGPDVAPTASGVWCATSFGCPDGERCDASACVADVICPPAQPARVLHAASAGDPFFDCGETLRSGDTEYFEGCGLAGDLRFVDLRRGGTSSLHSKRGTGSCGGDPTHCLLSGDGAQTLLVGVTRDDGAWSVERVLGGLAPLLVPDAADIGAGHVLQLRSESAGFVDLAAGTYQPWVELEGRSAVEVVRDWSGERRVVLATSTGASGARVLELAPLQAGGTFRPVLEQPPGASNLGVIMPTVDGWFAVADRGDGAGATVWHVTGEGTARVGDLEGSAVQVAAMRHHLGVPRLEEGRIGHALECDAQGDAELAHG